jgi:uncharacterized Zn finger protein
MAKVMLAAIAAVLLTPALAHGATNQVQIRGTVAVKQAKRHVLVIASRHGVVTTARVSARQLRHTRVGERLALAGRRLADGSLHVTKLRRLGSAQRARLSVVILKAKARRLLVAGGGSAFSIRLTRGTRLLAGKGSVRPGQAVKADVELSDDGPVGTTVEDAGDTPLIDFSGVVTAIGATSFTVTTDDIATVVQLPTGVTLPAVVQVGSEVEVVAAIDGSTLTLETIKLDDDNPGDDGGSDVDQGRVKVEGFVTALDTVAGSITIQPGDDAGAVTFAIPPGFTLPSGLADGSVVEARGELVGSVLTLTRLEPKNDDEGDQEVEAEGTVTALDTAAGTITIQSSGNDGQDDGGGGGSTTFTFTIPPGFTLPAGVAVGSSVEARGDIVSGVLTLTRLELQDDGGDG